MVNSVDEKKLQQLIDKEEIRSNLYRYARGVDRRDWDMFRSTYHVDAVDNHGGYNGPVDGLVEWVARRHAVIEQSFHGFLNVAIDFLSDDVAVLEAYEVCTQRYSNEAEETIKAWVGESQDVADDERLEIIMYARMVSREERRGGEWKTARREVVIEQTWWRIVPVGATIAPGVQLDRGPEDAVFRLIREGA